MNTLSWQSETTPLPMEINPRVVFERMFGGGGTATSAWRGCGPTGACSISSPTICATCRPGIGARDRARLDQYLDHVREIERRIQRAEQQAESLLDVPDAPVGVPESFEEHVGAAVRPAGPRLSRPTSRASSRSCSAASSASGPTRNIGVTEPHHTISHHGNQPPAIEAHAKVNTYHMTLFAKFLERLRSTPDGDGSLLDHSLILYGSGMGNGNVHAADPLPTLLVGGAAGIVKGNRHIVRRRADAERQPARERGREVRRRARPLRQQHRPHCALAASMDASDETRSHAAASLPLVVLSRRSARAPPARDTRLIDAVKSGNAATVRTLSKQRRR